MSKLFRVLGALWVLPIAIPIWALVLCPLWVKKWIYPYARRGLIVEFWTTGIGPRWWLDRWQRSPGKVWVGLSLPFALLLNGPWMDKVDAQKREDTRQHEEHHVLYQWHVLGIFFPVVYGIEWLIKGYRKHPMEEASREAEEE